MINTCIISKGMNSDLGEDLLLNCTYVHIVEKNSCLSLISSWQVWEILLESYNKVTTVTSGTAIFADVL